MQNGFGRPSDVLQYRQSSESLNVASVCEGQVGIKMMSGSLNNIDLQKVSETVGCDCGYCTYNYQKAY